MTIEHEQWKEILSTVNEEGNLSKDNVIEKIREKLPRYLDEYKKWDKASFNVNHLFHAVDKPDNPLLWEDDECTLLHLAARNNLENITEALLGVEGIDVNAADRLPVWTPLHYAAQFNSEKVIDILLKAEKININAESCRKCTPLHIAAHYDSGKAIDTLLKAKDIDVNVKNQDDETPLHCAAQFFNEGAISALLRAKDIDINAIDKDNKTPLHVVASESFGGEALNILIKGGADVKAVDKDGNIPLHLVASHYNDEGVVKALIENGADVNARNQDRYTPLHSAVQGGCTRTVKTLIEEGADVKVVNKNGSTPLHLAASRYNDEKIVKALLKVEEVDINALDENEWTPLHSAVRHASSDIVKILIENGADVNAANKDGSTPLHLAATHNKWVVGVLIDKKSDLFSKDNEGRTPRDLAEDDDTKKLLKVAEEKQLEKLSKKTDLPQDDKDTTRLLAPNRRNLSNQEETPQFKFLVVFKYSCIGSASAVITEIFTGAISARRLAITATARKLACIFYQMLKYGQEYVEKGMSYYETRYKERVVKNLIKKAQEFGYILVQQEELVKGVS